MKLVLKSKSNNWERFAQRKANPKFQKIRADVLYRDQFTCQFCFYQSEALEVINIDNDYHNNTPNNLISACDLCAQCTLLDRYALDYAGQDRIIYLPELTQEQVNHLCRTLFCKSIGEGDSAYNAKMIIAKLQDRAAYLQEKTQCHLDQPGIFVLYREQGQANQQLIQQLRWLPSIDSYQADLSRWQDDIEGMVLEP